MVTSYEIQETEMGNRVAKSFESKDRTNVPLDSSVKVQRADGSWCFPAIVFGRSNPLPRRAMRKHLRCVLMGLERDYQFEVPSKQLKYYSTLSSALSCGVVQESNIILLDPYFITGFTDAEGSFTVTIYPDKQLLRKKTGIRVIATFKIGLNERDLNLLMDIQKFFGGIGKIYHSSNLNS